MDNFFFVVFSYSTSLFIKIYFYILKHVTSYFERKNSEGLEEILKDNKV